MDTGMRAGELIDMTMNDLDRDTQIAYVVDKGRRPRAWPISTKRSPLSTATLRLRARHPHTTEPSLWLGKKGRMTDSGLRQMIERRGHQAGIGHIHPHQLRHTYAHNYLADGGNEGDLMALAGWRPRQILQRYGASAAAERAQAAYRRMGTGDRL